VRLIDQDGAQVGVVSLDEARQRAQDVELDLVEVGPNADPPVVKILDWGKEKFEREKKAREARRKTQQVEIKEVKYRPTIDPHDFEIKTKRAEKFLQEGKKVKEGRLHLGLGSDKFEYTLKADLFQFQTLSLPSGMALEEEEEQGGRILERIYLIDKAAKAADQLFSFFLKKRVSPQWLSEEVPRIRKWVQR